LEIRSAAGVTLFLYAQDYSRVGYPTLQMNPQVVRDRVRRVQDGSTSGNNRQKDEEGRGPVLFIFHEILLGVGPNCIDRLNQSGAKVVMKESMEAISRPDNRAEAALLVFRGIFGECAASRLSSLLKVKNNSRAHAKIILHAVTPIAKRRGNVVELRQTNREATRLR
jgi:hypothetical protein